MPSLPTEPLVAAALAGAAEGLGRVRLLADRLRWRNHPRPELHARVDAAYTSVMGMWFTDPLITAAYQSHHLGLALRAGDAGRLARALALEACRSSNDARPPRRQRAAQLLAAAHELLLRGGTRDELDFLVASGGWAANLGGNCQGGELLCARAIENYEARGLGDLPECLITRMFYGSSLAIAGSISALSSWLPRVVARADERNDVQTKILFIWQQACLSIAQDAPSEGLQAVSDVQSRQGTHDSEFLMALGVLSEAWIGAYNGDTERACQLLEALVPRLRRRYLLLIPSVAHKALSLRGTTSIQALRLAKTRGQRQRLLEIAEACAATLGRAGYALAGPYARSLRAALQLAQGDRRSAARQLLASATAYDTVGATLHAAADRLALAALGDDSDGIKRSREAHRCMQERGVVDPLKFARAISPAVALTHP
jgi:hypothetical protein